VGATRSAGIGSADRPTLAPGSRAQARSNWLAPPQRRRLAGAASALALALAITLLSWHALALAPGPGLDNSWQAALHMALHDGVKFGRQLIFTYGPLGFLSVPTLWYGDTGTIAVAYALLLRLALALAVFLAARRCYGSVAGAVVALAVSGASEVANESVPFLILCVYTVDRASGRARVAAIALAGAVAGLELLNKESTGIELAALALTMALATRGSRREHVGMVLGALALALAAGWAASGQEWGSLFAYFHNAERIVSGYAGAMGGEDVSLVWQYPAGLIAFAAGLAAAVKMTADGPPRRRWGIIALWLTFSFFEYKEGFVRHDVSHGIVFFSALMGGYVALRWPRADRPLALGLLALLVVFSLAAQQASTRPVGFELPGNVASAIEQLGQTASPAKRAEIAQRGRRAIERAYPLDPATLALLRGHTVHIAPYQASVAWAYGLDWRPLPVFQSYSTYTTGLDRENATALLSTRGPQRILRDRDPELDKREATFDEGLTTLAMLCHFRELSTTSAWQVLGRAGDRCAAPVALETVHAGWYQKVPIPPPPNDHSFVFVRIGGVQPGGLEDLLGLVFKPLYRLVYLDGTQYRLVEGTAADGLLLSAPGEVDYSAPFNLAPNSTTIAVGKVLGSSGGGHPITFSFYSESVNANSRGQRLPE
jgi:hypothetical protein